MAIPDQAQGYISGNISMMALCFVLVVARLSCRTWLSKKGLWWDDFFILLSFLFAVAFGAWLNVSVARYGANADQVFEHDSLLTAASKAYIVSKILFFLTTTSIRMALLLFYVWLVRDSNRSLRRIIYGCMIVNAAICSVACVLTFLRCSPVSAIWTYPQPAGSKCLDDRIVTITVGAISVSADLVVNILPIPIVARMNLPVSQRISATILLSLGSIATIAGIIREVWLYKVLLQPRGSTWEYVSLYICADVEIYVGLFCACIPSLKPLWQVVHDYLFNIGWTSGPSEKPDADTFYQQMITIKGSHFGLRAPANHTGSRRPSFLPRDWRGHSISRDYAEKGALDIISVRKDSL